MVVRDDLEVAEFDVCLGRGGWVEGCAEGCAERCAERCVKEVKEMEQSLSYRALWRVCGYSLRLD